MIAKFTQLIPPSISIQSWSVTEMANEEEEERTDGDTSAVPYLDRIDSIEDEEKNIGSIISGRSESLGSYDEKFEVDISVLQNFYYFFIFSLSLFLFEFVYLYITSSFPFEF